MLCIADIVNVTLESVMLFFVHRQISHHNLCHCLLLPNVFPFSSSNSPQRINRRLSFTYLLDKQLFFTSKCRKENSVVSLEDYIGHFVPMSAFGKKLCPFEESKRVAILVSGLNTLYLRMLNE